MVDEARHAEVIRAWQIFPYHLADYVCRVMRMTPFKYSCNLLFAVMREEKSYDRIPNFTVCFATSMSQTEVP